MILKNNEKKEKIENKQSGQEKMTLPDQEIWESFIVQCTGITHHIQCANVTQSNGKTKKTRPHIARLITIVLSPSRALGRK